MKVLVTGANGMLGQDLCPILENNGYSVVKTDIDNLDITNSKMVEAVLNSENPDIVIHCAAYTNVDKAEEDINTARLINSTGTENIAKACSKLNCTLVYVSTDYVFEGNGTRPYKPQDKTNPLNNYGLTKEIGLHNMSEADVKALPELLRNNFRFGRMCIIRTAAMAGRCAAPTVPLF